MIVRAQEFKNLFDKIQSGRTTRDERKTYTAYVELLTESVNSAYTGERRTDIRCISAEIRHSRSALYGDSSYIEAVYAANYWNLRTVVFSARCAGGYGAAHIMSASFCDGTDKVVITDRFGSLWIEGMRQPRWNTVPWAMDAILVLAGNNVVICPTCRYPYELCEHSKKDAEAIRCL